MLQVRDTATRIADARAMLVGDPDCWVATAGGAGEPGLVPLSFDWDGTELLLTTARTTPAGRNLRETGAARVALGELRDVVLVDATARELAMDEIPGATWDAYARRAGWDPRQAGPGLAAYLLRPTTILVWRTPAEFPGRAVMRDGVWVDA